MKTLHKPILTRAEKARLIWWLEDDLNPNKPTSTRIKPKTGRTGYLRRQRT